VFRLLYGKPEALAALNEAPRLTWDFFEKEAQRKWEEVLFLTSRVVQPPPKGPAPCALHWKRTPHCDTPSESCGNKTQR